MPEREITSAAVPNTVADASFGEQGSGRAVIAGRPLIFAPRDAN